jgi:DNA replication protein DnaC
MNLLRGFPKRYEDAPPAGGDGWLANYAQALATTDSGGITILYGGYGTGKTRMAWEVARAHKSKRPNIGTGGIGWSTITKKRPMIYTTAVNLFRTIKSTYTAGTEKSEKEVVSDYTEAALLVIDEVQERGETQYEDRQLTAIIDARYAADMPTILISNYTWERLSSTLSPAVIDRIEENGAKLAFTWESFRKKHTL